MLVVALNEPAIKHMKIPLIIIGMSIVTCASVTAQDSKPSQGNVQSNVVYGMFSGLALLMDVHRPSNPNGYGIIHIAGSGYLAPMRYDARPLKEDPQTAMYAKPLLSAGYTVFSINHRAAPRFRYPAALEDAQRCVRYVRNKATAFGIRPDRIGVLGGSSGALLASLLGVLDGKGEPEDPDPIERESAKVQCVVARSSSADQINVGASSAMVNFLGMLLERHPPASLEYKTYREASPVFHVSSDDAPFLLIHGDADILVPFKHSEAMERALLQAQVPVKLLKIEGGGHGRDFRGSGFIAENNWPDYLGEMVRWFDQQLKVQ